ncbi:MAG: DUF2599 domain-containing protein [Gordonia sp. (in: high G+C Gram-positive bacteria)]|uniref:DUF2599 domain-containing protein n=1 Tax=Gordonia sp. (in: high G+C Gram-positive bacteria) TaxID=84139 RepID=UPI003C70C983
MTRRVVGAVIVGITALMLSACSSSDETASDSTSSSAPVPVTSPVTLTSSTGPNEVLPPPYIASATWADTAVGPSLQIAPTINGRRVQSPTAGTEAWREVLALDPGADTPGMKAQFDCHWTFARLVEPNKPTWNLEPNRPVVTPEEMIASRCNPGMPEE